jgi:hypothetical protein
MYTELQLRIRKSRGVETYGYTLVTLTDTMTGERHRASGGGYDMVSTTLGDFIQDKYQERLSALARQVQSIEIEQGVDHRRGDLRATAFDAVTGMVSVDGGCGFGSLQDVAKHIGIVCEPIHQVYCYGKRCRVTGYKIHDLRSAQKIAA